MRVDGIPFEQGNTHGALRPSAVVLHRTYGGYDGSKAVAFGGNGIGFHFLIGKAAGRVVQLADTTQKCWHAKGGNDWSVGIEFEGVNEDPLTDWQISTAARIVLPVIRAHGIPLDYMAPTAGRRPPSPGVRNHKNVPGSDHTDYVSPEDWQRIVAAMSPEEDDMFSDQDRQAVEELRAQVARLTQLVEMDQAEVTMHVGGVVAHDTQQRAFTDEDGVFWRKVYRDNGITWDRLADGCVPLRDGIITDGTKRPLSKWGEFLAFTAPRPDGSDVRVVWTATEGWRKPEITTPPGTP